MLCQARQIAFLSHTQEAIWLIEAISCCQKRKRTPNPGSPRHLSPPVVSMRAGRSGRSLRGTSPRTHGPRSRHASRSWQHLLSACGDARPPARRPPSCSPPHHALRRNATPTMARNLGGEHGNPADIIHALQYTSNHVADMQCRGQSAGTFPRPQT